MVLRYGQFDRSAIQFHSLVRGDNTMRDSMKYGLSVVGRRSLLVIILFLYEMLWGFILYRYVKSVIIPLLYRYPGEEIQQWSALFWIEGEFRLMKTDMANGYVITLLLILLVRMALTPLINAGLFHAIHHSSDDQWRSFLRGMRALAGKFSFLYVIQMVLTFLPLYWLLPPIIEATQRGVLDPTIWTNASAALIGFILYAALIRLCFMYMQFAAVAGKRWSSAFLIWLKAILPVIGVSLCIVLITVVLQGILAASSIFWAGLTAVIIYQASPLIRVLCQVWEISSQHELWQQRLSDR